MNKVKRKPKVKPLSDADRLLAELLASTDAPFPPLRPHHWQADRGPRLNANRWAAQGQYHAHGVQLASGGKGSANVERQRLLASIAVDGLLVITRGARVKSPWLRLTEKGDSRARRLADMPSYVGAFFWLRKLAELADGKPDVWVSESAFTAAGKAYDSGEAALTLCNSLPFLVRGFAVAHSTYSGWCAYAITAAGIEALGRPKPAGDGRDIGRDDAAELYHATRREMFAALANAEIAPVGEIGEVPLRFDQITHLPPDEGSENQ